MTLSDKIGQMLLFGWQGETDAKSQTVNAHAAALIDELSVGGVILMGRNIGPPDALRRMLDELQQRAADHHLPPLFVATDQEGGRVQRLTPPHYEQRPAAWTVGQSGNPQTARESAAAIGRELKNVGINWDFAPVLDVNNNPENPVIGNRAYGETPEHVAQLGAAAVRGFQEDAGILACGKHFPGHGDTDTDSHLALPRIPHGRERLDTIELRPFRAAMDAGLAAIMTAHILFPALDPTLPATLSPTILTGLLRQEMGFDGLIITDSLEMEGVTQGWGSAESAVLAVLAGADIVLCCHTWATQKAIRNALMEAVQSQQITEARLDESLTRIATAKQRWVQSPPSLRFAQGPP